MKNERDDRWVYVALAILAIAYIVYRRSGTIRVDLKELRRLGSVLPYALPPLIAVLVNVYTKRRAARARAEWEKIALNEGILREELNVKASAGGGLAGGVFAADLRLTRAAFYVFDRTHRRSPLRILIRRDTSEQLGVGSVALTPGDSEGRRVLRVDVEGPKTFSIEILSQDSEGWWRGVRRAQGKSTKLVDRAEPLGDEGIEAAYPGQ
jgi:hypothetical protein